LAVLLANHALKRGYRATIYTYNLQLFDPIWFKEEGIYIEQKLIDQLQYKKELKFQLASKAYIEFLKLGGKLLLEDLNEKLNAANASLEVFIDGKKSGIIKKIIPGQNKAWAFMQKPHYKSGLKVTALGLSAAVKIFRVLFLVLE
jgi:hypothetical protein